MLELKDGFIFYHGSYCEVKEPDLTQCAKRKDFGQGFYLTTSVEHDMEKYDVIAGKIADDATNATLTAYLAGAFGAVGDKEADDFCIKQLLPNKLKDQYCFKTEAAIECLKFVEGEKIWLK